MKIMSVEFFCDICKKKIENKQTIMSPDSIAEPNYDFNKPPDSLTYVFGSGVELNIEHICKDCGTKIKNYIDELIKLKGE